MFQYFLMIGKFHILAVAKKRSPDFGGGTRITRCDNKCNFGFPLKSKSHYLSSQKPDSQLERCHY